MTDIAEPLDRLLDELEQTILQRHKKYGALNVSQSPGGPLNGLRVRLYDKLARLNNHVDGNAQADFDDDSLRDCFVDVAGYALIGLLVLDGVWPGVSREAKPTEPKAKILPIGAFPGESATGTARPASTFTYGKNHALPACLCGVCKALNPPRDPGLPSKRKRLAHNHDYDPSCNETKIDGLTYGDCLAGTTRNGAA